MFLALVAQGLHDRSLEPAGIRVLFGCVGWMVWYLVGFGRGWKLAVLWCWVCRGWVCEVGCGLFLHLANEIETSFQRAVYLGKRLTGEARCGEHLNGICKLPDCT